MFWLSLCFDLHQPFRVHPEGSEFLWDEKNRSIFLDLTEQWYLPSLCALLEMVSKCTYFHVSLNVSGTFLEQAESYQPEVIAVLQKLAHLGEETGQIELLDQTYHHSLASLFSDPERSEFKEQVSLHRKKIYEMFGIRPTAFADTEFLFDRDVAEIVTEMGYQAILCEPYLMASDPDDPNRTTNTVFHAIGKNGKGLALAALPCNHELAGQLPITQTQASEVIRILCRTRGELALLVYPLPPEQKHISDKPSISVFLQVLVEALGQIQDYVTMANPSEIARRFLATENEISISIPAEDAGPAESIAYPPVLLGRPIQRLLFNRIQILGSQARLAGGEFLRRYRYLTSSDHLVYITDDAITQNGTLNPYGSPVAATYALTHATDELLHHVKSFNIRKKTSRTPILIVTPETARLPSEGMGQFAKYVSGKSGGLGEVVSALCQGLSQRGIPVHLITINLSRRFREEAGLSEAEWIQKRHHLNPQNVHLVSSSIFEEYRSAYEGSPPFNAAEFQRQMVNTYIKEIRSGYEGRALLHTHDWMAGGVVPAYARIRGIPVLHTVHNTHTGGIPLEMMQGVNLRILRDHLVIGTGPKGPYIDCQASAIRSATRISYVGDRFLREVVGDCFLDRQIIPPSVRQETKAKYVAHAAIAIPNGISPDMYPEWQPEGRGMDDPGLAKRFGLESNLLEAKRLNLLKFQQRMGLQTDPEAILLYWPSRLDPAQKGIELLEDIALRFVEHHPDVQIAIVGDPVGGNPTHVEYLGRIACASKGRIAFHRFEQDLSILGYAAARDVFGASLYEPFGQIDVVGNLFGATATNRDTGGYADKISLLRIRAWGAPIDRGNGVLFRDYDSSGLWWGLSKTVEHHRYFRANPAEWQRQMRRMMKEARDTWSLDNMVAQYITAYEELNDGKPLI
ncbi:MAG: glycogen/starch synthase [Sedimentisphaerales bacterium]|nr:glycogen/starch synthase [Sedimentisphaerales bacterium]